MTCQPGSGERVPTELAQLMGRARWRAVAKREEERESSLIWRPDVLPRPRATALLDLLEREMRPVLRRVERDLPNPRTTSSTSYTEVLPKVLRNSSALLNNRRSLASQVATQTGLLDLMRSATLRDLAERLAGVRLGAECGCQVIRYGEGDYVGPHHDAHPEDAHLRRGYVDFHLSVCSADVESQTLVHQHGRHFGSIIDFAGSPSGITVSRLPFWHYTTPLVAKPRRGRTACRWLLLTSFEIETRRSRHA